MKKIYIFGHKNPDTDSVTSALSLEYLKKQMGINCVSCVLGKINNETSFVLNYFGIRTPMYLNDVKLQLKDINYHKDFCMSNHSSIMQVHDFMVNNNTTGVAIIDSDKKFVNVVTSKDLLSEMFKFEKDYLNTSYENILDVINGKNVLKFDDEINGHIIAAGYKSSTFLENVELTKENILIVANRNSIIEKAILSKVKLIVLTSNTSLKDEHLKLAKENKVNVISTSYQSFLTSKKICSSNYITNVENTRDVTVVYENDHVDDFIDLSKKLKYNNYPVLNKSGICKGLLRITELDKYDRKKVIIVDHNEEEQSVLGLNEAEILEVIDHHKIGNISTNNPINFRNMAVGSTNTIIYFLFRENKIEIPYTIAGLMLSGILSDTLCFKSPTTTEIDKEVGEKLAKICKIDIEKYSGEMFKAASSLKGKSIMDVITGDMKEFVSNDIHFLTSQSLTMDEKELLERKDEILSCLLDAQKDNRCSFSIFVITNILKEGSYILYTDNAKNILENAFPNIDIKQGFFVKGLISRKKQLIPLIIDNL